MSMDKYLEKWKASSTNNRNVNSEVSCKKPKVEEDFLDCDVIGDPGLTKLIDSYYYEIRDELRRQYVAKSRTQPHDLKLPQSTFGKLRRSF